MIRLEGVSKNYAPELPPEAGGRPAVDAVSISFAAGQVSVLLGPSGSGKTTLLRLINRMVEPDSGRILLDGVDTAGLDPVRLRRGMGYVIQGIGLFPHLTVGENMALVPRLLGWPAARIRRRCAELLEIVRLPASYLTRRPRQLSGGEAQRVGVARALAADPPVLLMDEPFGALDVVTREALQDEFCRIQRDLRKTVVFVTHDVAEAVRLADNIVLMSQGRIVQSGPPEALFGRPADPFVGEFLGERYPFELLHRHRLACCLETAAPDAPTAAALAAARRAGLTLPADATLGAAMLQMMRSGRTALPVAGADDSGWLRFDSLAGILSGPLAGQAPAPAPGQAAVADV